MSDYHDPVFMRDADGNAVVARYPFPGEYPVTARTGPIERGIAS